VHDVIERSDVFRATVLVAQIVGVLPDVQTEDRRVAVHQRAVLVAAAFHDQCLFRGYAQPSPAAAETGQRGFGERILEGLYTAQLLVNGLGQRPGWQTAALGAHDVPE
nr:hypothetical protein [Tanacetum cinerariifolium]